MKTFNLILFCFSVLIILSPIALFLLLVWRKTPHFYLNFDSFWRFLKALLILVIEYIPIYELVSIFLSCLVCGTMAFLIDLALSLIQHWWETTHFYPSFSSLWTYLWILVKKFIK